MQTNKLTKGDIVFCRSVTFAAFYTPDRFLKPVRCGVTAPTIFVFHFWPSFSPQEISIWVLGGFSVFKKFLHYRKSVFPGSKKFLRR
jgi:hypothetical protein